MTTTDDTAVGRAVRNERVGHVEVLTINRPKTRNALSTEVLRGLAEGLDAAAHDDQVRAVVLTGGSRIFASGADLRELRDNTPSRYLLSERQQVWPLISRFPKPLVAAVAGYVLGGGCEIAMSCDFIVAGDSAVLGQPEINLGIIPGAGGTQRWSRVCGRFRAADLVMTGRTLDAWTAHRFGMVHQVVPSECVVEAGVALAARLAQASPIAQRLGKAALRQAEEVGISAGLDFERSQLAVLLSTADKVEGISAFLEKRPAEFHGE
ncbi:MULTISPECIES: enoyl-CoA hydratase-related protein [unclassified Nocardioides]|uniref:enoyl-CoA hydratase-related protein n=1 Tax=unclassified Nocardioides TaxID=2615069 RepID=UPI00360A639C